MSGAVEQSLQHYNLMPTIIGGVIGIAGAVIGGLAGGLPAWLLAKRQSNETLRRDREQRTEREKALAFSVSVKLLIVVNSTINLRNHVQTCLAVRRLPGNENMEPLSALVPMIGHTDEGTVRFVAEEMAVFEAAKERDFMMDTMLLGQRHASSLASFQKYCELREELSAIMPTSDAFEGEMGSVMLTREQLLRLKPRTIMLNSLVIQLENGLEEDLRLARNVALAFGPIVQRYFNEPTFPGVSFPSDEDLTKMRDEELAKRMEPP